MDVAIYNGNKVMPARYQETITYHDKKISYNPTSNIEVYHVGKSLVVLIGTLWSTLKTNHSIETGDIEQLKKDALDADGSFAMIIFREGETTIISDYSASIPLYYGFGKEGFSISTLPQDVAYFTGNSTIDLVSAVDFIMNQSVCFPYSWYEGVRLIPPGSVCQIENEQTFSPHVYWEPVEPYGIYGSCDVDYWAERLYQNIRRIVENSTSSRKHITVLFSGGHDSRAIASFLTGSKNVNLVSVLSKKNREYRIAKRAAALLKLPYEILIRPENFYENEIRNKIDLTGPGNDHMILHFADPVSEGLLNTDVLVGGYMADTLFKSYPLLNLKGKFWQLKKLLPPAPDKLSKLKMLHSKAFRDEYVKMVKDRRYRQHGKLKKIRPKTAGNWHSLWPLSGQRYHLPQYTSSLKIGPQVIEPFLFNSSYKIASEMPDTCRVDEKAFRKAFLKQMRIAGYFPTSSGLIPGIGGNIGAKLKALLIIRRFFYDRISGKSGQQTSWGEKVWNEEILTHEFSDEEVNQYQKLLLEIIGDDYIDKLKRMDDVTKLRTLALAYKFKF